MRPETKARQETAVTVKCPHYWIIESPQGPVSQGVCQYCGAEREFYNSWRHFVGEGQLIKPSEGR